MARLGEERDSYPAIVAMLNERRRVIDGNWLQWILQRRDAAGRSNWRGNAYCRTRDGLLSCIRARCGEVGEAGLRAVERLPAWQTRGAA